MAIVGVPGSGEVSANALSSTGDRIRSFGHHMTSTIDFFLDNEEPCASFHDARLISLNLNYERRELVSEWQLCVGNPDAPERSKRERSRRGRLRFTGAFFWIIDPHEGLLDGSPPWLTSAGPLLEAGTPLAKELSKRVPEGAAAWYFYFSDLNAFAYCSAKHGAFEWLN
jgi:hypothetical protein